MIFSSSSDLAVDSKHAASSGEASGDEQTEEKIEEAGFSGRQVGYHLLVFLSKLVEHRIENKFDTGLAV